MLNVICHQRNVNQTTMRYHFISSTIAIIRKTDNTHVDKDMETLEPVHIASGNVKWYNNFGEQSGSS